MTTQFQPGDRVLRYNDHHDKVPTREVVQRVTSRTVVLESGERFTTSGDQWGFSGRWFRAYIRHAPKEAN
jgi:hypothetical protein